MELKLYEIPTPEELRSFLADNNLTNADIEALTGAKPRTVRCWIAPADSKGFTSIPWTAWALINLLLGKTDCPKLLKKIDKCKKEQTGKGLFEKGIGGRPRKIT